MATTREEDIQVGTQLAHYRIDRPIGAGSMGVVYRAHDLGLDRPVALKVLKKDVSEDEEFVDRFVREARAAARVAHPNLTHIYFVGEENGCHFFAMELVDGEDLETRVREGGALTVGHALDVAIQVAKGLGVAHAAGVIHRDVKPSNILLEADDRARVTDFGLAKSLDAEVSHTRAGQVIGTPLFMSPEQCRGREVDERTDTYCLGMTLWYLLAGRVPYETNAVGELINAHINTPVPSLETHRADVPAGLDDVLARLCAKDPAERPEDMAEVVRLLEPFRTRKIQRASLVTRALAAFVDMLVLIAFGALVEKLVDRVLGHPHGLDTVWGTVFLSLLCTAYFVLSEARWQQTLGKWLLQVHVVSIHGTPPPRRVLLPRFAIRYPAALLGLFAIPDLGHPAEEIVIGIEGIAVLAGIGWYFATKGRSLSDKITRTRVAIRPQDDDDDDLEELGAAS